MAKLKPWSAYSPLRRNLPLGIDVAAQNESG
jgi:hypothetical protein